MSTSEIPTPIYPGVDLDANRGPEINALTITFTAISFVTICLRFFSRWWTKIALGKDDYLIIFAAAFCWTYSGLLLFEVEHNFFGQHIGKSDVAHLTSLFKGLYPIIMLYTLALTFSKLSLLALYWRIFQGSATRQWPIILAVGANVIWMTIIVFMSIFICHPIHAFWDFSVPSKCFPYNTVFIVNEGITIGLDVVVLIMPAYFISSIKRSLSQRISISSTFLLGLVVTIISVIRLWRLTVSIKIQAYGTDPTFTEVDSVLWGAIEINLWIVVASIPTVRPLFGKIIRLRKESRKDSQSHTYVNSSIRAKFTRPVRTGNTLPSLMSYDVPGVEDYSVLIHAKGQVMAGNGDLNEGKTANMSEYELHDVSNGIRVERAVDQTSNHTTAQ